MVQPAMAIKLNSTGQIPQPIRHLLRGYKSLFAKYDLIQKVLENTHLYGVAEELNQVCLQEGIIGYHFTRAIREDIEARGLQLGCGTDRRSDFVSRHGHRFSEAQRERMHRMWDDYFDALQTWVRDGKIWFSFTLDALDNGGADRLLTYFGGEVVYMPLTEDKEIAAILQTIGQPLIVECVLAAERLRTFSVIPWGTIWLSSYHVTVNRDALQNDMDAYSEEPVSVSQIVSIRVAVPRGVESDSDILPTRWKDPCG